MILHIVKLTTKIFTEVEFSKPYIWILSIETLKGQYINIVCPSKTIQVHYIISTITSYLMILYVKYVHNVCDPPTKACQAYTTTAMWYHNKLHYRIVHYLHGAQFLRMFQCTMSWLFLLMYYSRHYTPWPTCRYSFSISAQVLNDNI